MSAIVDVYSVRTYAHTANTDELTKTQSIQEQIAVAAEVSRKKTRSDK